MGKKTDAMMLDIQKLLKACSGTMSQLTSMTAKLDKIDAEIDKLAGTFQMKGGELLEAVKTGQLDKQLKAKGAKATDADKQGVASAKLLLQQWDKLMLPFMSLFRPCDFFVNTFSQKLQLFDNHVKKKEASKNPFKSKKAVPAAKEFLKDMRKLEMDFKVFFQKFRFSPTNKAQINDFLDACRNNKELKTMFDTAANQKVEAIKKEWIGEED